MAGSSAESALESADPAHHTPPAGGRPVDRVIGAYLLVSAPALLPPSEAAHWLLLVVHLLAGLVLVTGRLPGRYRARGAGATDTGSESDTRAGRSARVVVDWYPLLLVPLLYAELPILNGAIWDGQFFDGMVQRWEAAVFGGQPARTLWVDLPALWLSELLHAAYLSYFLVLYIFPLIVYLRRPRAVFHRVVFAMLFAFVLHYAVFVYFPVKGPYFLFPPPGQPASDGIFYSGVQAVLGFGASSGTAFPSSHTALSTVQTANAIRYVPALAPVLAITTLGIAIGAVYAGVHYAVDTAAGLAAGILIALVVPAIRRRLK